MTEIEITPAEAAASPPYPRHQSPQSLRLLPTLQNMILQDPHFRPTPSDLEILTKDVHEDIRGIKPRSLPNDIRKKLVGRIAEDAVAVLLRQLSTAYTVIDANRQLAMNHPGYDFLIDGRLRIQVKGSPWVELIGWSHGSDTDHVSMGYNLLVFVDIGCMIDARVGRLKNVMPAPKDAVDFYVVPGDVVRSWVDRETNVSRKRVRLHAWRRPVRPGSKRDTEQLRELLTYRSRFDLITSQL